jgi:rSAM/selenodomain-associated transferase 1
MGKKRHLADIFFEPVFEDSLYVRCVAPDIGGEVLQMNNGDCVGIFLKFPVPGFVKTRIASEIGSVEAAIFYKQLAESVLKKTMPAADEYDRIIFFEPAERKMDFEKWLGNERLVPQQGIDLGEKMSNAVSEILKQGRKAVITGSDIPDLDRSIIGAAFSTLEHNDIVLGPAKDGGYYLVGMKVLHQQLFEDIHWSTAEVLSRTVEIIKATGLTCSLLPELSDLDTIEDYKKYIAGGFGK